MGAVSHTSRSCVQCGATKTPQWREGPAGVLRTSVSAYLLDPVPSSSLAVSAIPLSQGLALGLQASYGATCSSILRTHAHKSRAIKADCVHVQRRSSSGPCVRDLVPSLEVPR